MENVYDSHRFSICFKSGLAIIFMEGYSLTKFHIFAANNMFFLRIADYLAQVIFP